MYELYQPACIDNFNQNISKLDIGKMDTECTNCGALRYTNEGSRLCCNNGKIKLMPLTVPQELQELYQDKKFKRHSRGYNQAFAISSIGGLTIDKSVNNGATQTYRVCGKAYHQVGSVRPQGRKSPQFAQMYVYDSIAQDEARAKVFSTLDKSFLTKIRQILESINPYVQKFQQLKQISRNESYNLVFHHFDDKIYNAPTVAEVGAIQDPRTASNELDVQLKSKNDGKLSYVNDISSCFDPIQYLLIHPRGEQGWSSSSNNTCMKHYAFHAFSRKNNKFNNPLQLLGPLAQQYWVEQGLKMERLRLKFLTFNQSRFRFTSRQAVRRAFQGNKDVTGKKLPSSVTGSPRYMNEKFKDTIRLCEKYGGPHLFITPTCNPKWDEITRELLPGQSPYDRPELLTRVFKLKLDKIKEDILKNGIFGKAVCYVHVIEFQKRMLPHAHIAVCLEDGNPLTSFNSETIDKYIYAEIPDPNKNPILFQKVTKHHLHNPCQRSNHMMSCQGSNGLCKDHFPKQFTDNTIQDKEGWTIYKRRSVSMGGFTVSKKIRGKEYLFTNEDVIPYNPYLFLKYDCHINVEFVNTIAPIKYLFKYFHKGPSMASASITNDKDEIQNYITGRYMTACEALWRILGFSMVERNIPVMPLVIHLPNNEGRVIQDLTVPDEVVINPNTKLVQFFKFCKLNPNLKLLYEDIPTFATWKKQNTKKTRSNPFITYGWSLRKRHTNQIGRIQTVPHSDSEGFHLRLLLKNVHSPTSFVSLRRFRSKTYKTFQEAAAARGLLNNTEQLKLILEEAKSFQMPSTLCDTFASMLIFCDIPNPAQFFDTYLQHFTDDLPKSSSENVRRNVAAWRINQVLKAHGQDVTTYLQNVEPRPWVAIQTKNKKLYQDSKIARNLLHPDQLEVYNKIIGAIQNYQSNTINYKMENINTNMFYIDAPAGYGKTYLLNALIGTCKDGNVATTSNIPLNINVVPFAAVSSTNQSADLLIDAGTAHSYFNIPLKLYEGASCNVCINSNKAKQLKELQLIIFDEVSSAHRYLIEAIDNTMRDITNINQPFGGIVVVFCGCYRQTLPVIPRGSKANIIASIAKQSPLWEKVTSLRLKDNKRTKDLDFQKYLMKIANGSKTSDSQMVSIYKKINISSNPKDLTSNIYDSNYINQNIENIHTLAQYYKNRAILAPLNTEVQEINNHLIQQLTGPSKLYLSTNFNSKNAKKIPARVMASYNPPDLPPHDLTIKIGMPVMLIRTINKVNGLNNGARGVVTKATDNCIQIKLLTGSNAGEFANVFRIYLNSDPEKGFKLTRFQFPIKPAFAFTINKAQGTTIKELGIMLQSNVFAHGQLYVALSRATDPTKIHICLNANDKVKLITQNVVYREVLT
jgi:hypothetical protein